MTAHGIGTLITGVTRETLGIAISPHLFRTADATTAAISRTDLPYLATALLGHSGPQVTEDYNRAGSLKAAETYAEIVNQHHKKDRRATGPQ